ncbi:MAG TPA: PilT/PilU family type 4a pilus ATPase [Actinomycetota bacterium]|jgi:twitching motility protein PilT|nr:PilT/PilU family type 4a pilus ATPase [Actinomycetota bacterium]
MNDIHDLLKYVVEHNASDLHLKAGTPPSIRVGGKLGKINWRTMTVEDLSNAAGELMNAEQQTVLKNMGEVDFAYSEPGSGRFRVNIHSQRGSVAIAARLVLPGAPSFRSLGLPAAVENLANEHRGLLLVTGPTSSGKTTTTGAVINHINSTRPCHILTIEDPIEILHHDQLADVTQREIGQDTTNFATALRAAMRQDPDVIFVGEIRDYETVNAALQAAETGHFVVATLHTTNVTETISRVIDFYPPHQAKQVRAALAGSLVGIVSQRLLPRAGGGRVAAIEVMVSNGRIRDCILNPDKTHEIFDIVADGSFYGMQTFDQALVNLYRAGLVTLEDARSAATNPHDFEIVLKQEGLAAV